MGGLSFDTLAAGVDFDAPAPTGKPLDIPLADIAENLDNPRTEFDPKYLAELAADIKANGVKSPVSIQKNPTGEPPWILNYGACRHKASLLADKQTIPAFVDEQFTDYDAVAENEQRRNLTAMELASFIQKRIEQGEKKKDIAAKLHKDQQTVTHHLALIDAPDAIEKAYREGRVTTARTIYELVKLHEKYGDAVANWCKGNDSITRGTVNALAITLKQPNKPSNSSKGDAKGKSESDTAQKAPEKGLDSPKADTDAAHFADLPALLVTIGKRRAIIVMERKPTARGMAWVRYLDDDSTAEVKLGSCTLIELADAADLQKQEEGEGVT